MPGWRRCAERTAARWTAAARWWLLCGTLRWLNRLHNYRLELDEALRSGELSRDEYESELPRGQALLSYLGCGGL